MTNYGTNSLPAAFIGINKNRLKTYSAGYNLTSVYLEDKQDFQIELFNPTENSVLAKIKLNGKYISDKGLVLRPGERVWLDRYIDENRKFQFSTYQVEANDYQVDNATRNNGLVEIEFYDEKIRNTINTAWTTNTIYYSNTTQSPTFGHSTLTSSNDFLNFEPGVRGIVGDQGPTGDSGLRSKSLKETGRVEKGETSNQNFNEVDMEFNSWVFHTVKYKIVSASELNLNSNDVRVKYCTDCGKKITKTTWKFCPDCGEKI